MDAFEIHPRKPARIEILANIGAKAILESRPLVALDVCQLDACGDGLCSDCHLRCDFLIGFRFGDRIATK
jgi:hypothetical protein